MRNKNKEQRQSTSQERHELVSRLLEGAERDKTEMSAYPSGTETHLEKDGPAMCTLIRKASKLSQHPDFRDVIDVEKETTKPGDKDRDEGTAAFTVKLKKEGSDWTRYTSDDLQHAIVFSRVAGIVEGIIDEQEREIKRFAQSGVD